MAPMAIDGSFTGLMNGDVDGDIHVEDVVIAGAGPAGLMLAYVRPGHDLSNTMS
jgi:ribulose 1,5-bisphosphate synthetase/thiazole synthase